MLASSRVFGPVDGDGECLTWMMLRMFSGVTTCGDACEKVAIRSGMAESIPSRLSGFSALVEGRAPKAADGGFLPGMLCRDTGAEFGGKSAAAIPRPPGGVGGRLWQCNAEVQ